MKVQVRRLPLHQNAKVFAVLYAVGSLVFVVPFGGASIFNAPVSMREYATFNMLALPFVYLLFGYVSAILLCWLYNVLAKLIGGFEFETESKQNAA
jgi:hypothetical protein